MKLGVSAFRLAAGALLALGLLAAPASAQYYAPRVSADAPPDISEETPWYMPQPWVHPPKTGPQVRKLPGYYGHTYRNRSYGGFSNYCYGNCPELPGTVATRSGVVLFRPTVAIFDPRGYQLVPRAQYQPPQDATKTPRAKPVDPAVVSVDTPTERAEELLPKFSMENGVRIIRPAPVTAY